VAVSHGKTTTTAMIMHVLKHAGIKFDYMVGSAIDGYETMVGISDESKVAVFEGDEYLSSPVDRRPKFHLYIPDIAIINGIAWDHMNVFPTFENYLEQFRTFVSTITPGGTLIYYADDREVKEIADNADPSLIKIGYRTHGYFQNKLGFYGASVSHVVPLKVFGEHNMQNLSAAREACLAVGVSVDSFYDAIQSFEGTSRRLQKLAESEKAVVYLDFAHAPSKVKATVEAVASRYEKHTIVACLELHTYSSLNMAFLPQYKGSLEKASRAYVYFNPHAVEMKKLERLSVTQVGECFGGDNVKVFDDSVALMAAVRKAGIERTVYLFMSSGDFNGTDLEKLASELV
jgi:UDP-N-acetylmuramate: L-alanyl-gamma-D-glutamyl-meso-diaminopimelate ligase